jgi:copper chaperone CopZ
VKRSLEGIEGVKEVKVSYKEARAWVVVEPAVTDKLLEEAVSKAGRFTGKVIGREPASASVDGQGSQ